MRLDKYLSLKFPEKSRTYIQKIIEDFGVSVNKKLIHKSGFEVKDEDEVEIKFPEVKKLNLKAKKIPLNVIYEDDSMLIINKQPGISVHPSETSKESTLVNAVLNHCKGSLSGIGGIMRPGIVHRLDKDTSGVLMIAKNDQTHQYLSNLIKNREVKKIYLGIIHGKMQSLTGKIDSPIGRSYTDRKKMAVKNDVSGKNAITNFKVIHYIKELDISLLEIQIITGRTHQIRVHMAAIKHPIVFDSTYGDKKLDNDLTNMLYSLFPIPYSTQRQMLHAWKLELKMPNDENTQAFEAKIPEDFQAIIPLLIN